MGFICQKIVRFAHCDPAGIVFYPRYVELCNEVVEDWFREGLGVDFHTLHEQHRLGIPTVKLEVEFLKPSRYGEALQFALHVCEMGQTSLRLRMQASCGSEVRVRFQLKVVMLSMQSRRPVPIDALWRERFANWMSA